MDLSDNKVSGREEVMEIDSQELASDIELTPPPKPIDLPVMPPSQFDRTSRPFRVGKGAALNETAVKKDGFAIIVPSVQRPWDYMAYEEPNIEEILEEYEDEDAIYYLARFTDGTEEEVSWC